MESSGGREDQFWASGESGTLTAIVPVNHVPSYPEQSSLSLTNPYPSSSNGTQYRSGMEHEAYGPPPSSAGRRVVAQKTHSRESSNHRVSASQTTQSSREISRSSRTTPYAQSSPSTELRRQRKDDTSAYLGEFAQFRSHPESSSLRNHGMQSLSVSPANSHHSSPPSSYHNPTSLLHPNPTAASPLNNTTPPSVYHNGRSTGSWYDYDTSGYQNSVAPHDMGQYSQQDPSTMFQTQFGSTPLSAHTHNMIYDNHQQTYIAQNPSHSYRVGSEAPTMYNTNPHYPHNSHSSTHGHSSSNSFHPY